MSNSSAHGRCPGPFYDEALFTNSTGYIQGRVCAIIPGGLSCCLPCPSTKLLYPDRFYNLTEIPGYIAVGSLALCAFVLLAFVALPAEQTKRHYLNTCLILSIVLLELGVAVPVFVKPEQCADEITPRGMSDSTACALSGAFIVIGGCAANFWILARVISMHLQICWDIAPGKAFFWISQVLAWGLAALVSAMSLVFTGVSFRFGDYCHVNSDKALQSLWGPLLGVSGTALILQTCTFGYCLKVYLQSFLEDRPATEASGPSSYVSTSRTKTAHGVWKRLNRVLRLQWRSLVISALVAVDVVYLSVVFVVLNTQIESIMNDFDAIQPWVLCILTKDKDQCMPLAEQLRPSEGILVATLILLSIVGLQACLLIGRRHMLTGWFTLFSSRKRRSGSANDFVTLESGTNTIISPSLQISAPQLMQEKSTFELRMFATPSTIQGIASPQNTYKSPLLGDKSPMTDFTTSPTSSTQSPPMTFSAEAQPLIRHSNAQAIIIEQNPIIRPLQSQAQTRTQPQPHTAENASADSRPVTREKNIERRFQPSRFSFSTPRPPSAGRSNSPTSSIARSMNASRPNSPPESHIYSQTQLSSQPELIPQGPLFQATSVAVRSITPGHAGGRTRYAGL